MIDFHAHILPGIDDGSRNLDESIGIARKQREQGVQVVIATPHFYPDKDIDVFLQERQVAYELLKKEVDGSVYLGAEVLLSIDTPKITRLRELAIEGTNYILIELPFSHWSEWVYVALQEIIDNHKLTPIIAHIERYNGVVDNLEHINKLIRLGALIQINTSSFRPKSSRKKFIKRLIKKKLIHVIGSDVHREKSLMTVAQGYTWIEKQYGKEAVNYIQETSKKILEGEHITIRLDKPFKKVLGLWWM